MKKPKDKPDPAETFDGQLDRLRSIVEKLEHGGLTLDDSLTVFEEGIGVSRNLFRILNQAEGKIEELLANMERVPFGEGDG